MRAADDSVGQAGVAERTWFGRRWSLKEEEKSGGEGQWGTITAVRTWELGNE